MEYITERVKDGTACDFSLWESFLRDLNHDLQTYKNTNHKLEQFIRQKDSQHQSYVGLNKEQRCTYFLPACSLKFVIFVFKTNRYTSYLFHAGKKDFRGNRIANERRKEKKRMSGTGILASRPTFNIYLSAYM